jgi:SAM-dependent methyltransferase
MTPDQARSNDPAASVSLGAILAEQERAWRERPVLRQVYRDAYGLIASRLSHVEGPTVELGSGIGRFKEVVPDVTLTDVEATPWSHAVVDAENLPYETGSIANLVLFDVFHHLASPRRFFDEARRVLVRGGRIVIFDPYCSPLSTRAYKAFHHERTDLGGQAFDDDPEVAVAPFASNMARATLVFFRGEDEFARRWPDLTIVERRKLSLLLYPLSGGFSGRQLVAPALVRPLELFEQLARPLLASIAGFRCLVVLERR